MRQRLHFLLPPSAFLLCCAVTAFAATAEEYPNRPVRVLVPATAGGATDIAARVLVAPLTEAFGKPFVVDNRPGANGIIGTETVARAAPDGHTLMVVFDAFATVPFIFKSVPYDNFKDFAPISLLIRGPQLLVVHPKLGAKTLGEFLALA